MTGDEVEQGVEVPPTPRTSGYVMTYVVAALTVALLLTLVALVGVVTDDGVAAWYHLPLVLFYALVLGLVLGAPAALVVTALVHRLLGGDQRQWVHVLAFGAGAALAAVLTLLAVTQDPGGLRAYGLVGGIAGLGAAAGRLVVSREHWRRPRSADWMRELHG